MMTIRILASLFAFCLCFCIQAGLRLPATISNGMVLQQKQKVPVWGWTEPGTRVTVSFADKTYTDKADKSGKFFVRLKKQAASSEPRVLTVSAGEDTIEIQDVLVGEVWLCSGQSNMEMSVSRCRDYEKEAANANFPQIRMFSTQRNTSLTPLTTCEGSWKTCSAETVGSFSATGYFFGRALHHELQVPVGLIRSAWGGTCVEAWSPMPSLAQFDSVMETKRQMDQQERTFDQAKVNARFKTLMEAWKVKEAAAIAAGKKPPKPPRKAIQPHKDQNYPANLYNSMIHPHVPYGIRGAIWYQGERNAKTPETALLYRDLLENLVTQWRKDWDSHLPFYAVQLVNFKKPVQEPVQDSAWAFIRDSFLTFHKEVPNVGIAVGIDVGEEKDIHPKDKQTIGYRLAQQALKKTYKQDVVAGGPIYRSIKADGDAITVRFDDTGSGLFAKGGPLQTFALAGEDRNWVAAQAEIVGNTVVVRAPGLPEPVAVRYAWADNPVGCNLYNQEGFPASPFRSDHWEPEPATK